VKFSTGESKIPTASCGESSDAISAGEITPERTTSMKELPFKALFCLLLAFLMVSCAESEQEAPAESAAKTLSQAEIGDYSHGIAVEDMRFLWRLRGDSIDIKLAAPTRGWVAVGFNPETGRTMKGANLLIGLVKDGKAEVVDDYGTMKDKHSDDDRIGGESNVSNVSGSEKDGETEVEFTIPLNSGDTKDTPLSPKGESTVLLAYGKSDRLVLKHKFRAILKVDLSTGDNTVVTVK